MDISKEAEQKIGEALVGVLNLKQVRDEDGEHYNPPRYELEGGTKTAIGVYRTLTRVIEEAKPATNAPAIEFPDALEKSGLATPEVLEVVVGLHKALARMIDKHDPDTIEAEWLSHSNEVVRKLTGHDVPYATTQVVDAPTPGG